MLAQSPLSRCAAHRLVTLHADFPQHLVPAACKSVHRARCRRQAKPLCHETNSASDTHVKHSSKVASIDVEYAHFRCSEGRILAAAAEVCLLAEDGGTLQHTYIIPGKTVKNRSLINTAWMRVAAEVAGAAMLLKKHCAGCYELMFSCCSSRYSVHAECSNLTWIGGVKSECYQQAPDLKSVQQELSSLLAGL